MCVYCDAPNRVDVDNDGAPVVASKYPQWFDVGWSDAYGMIVRFPSGAAWEGEQ